MSLFLHKIENPDFEVAKEELAQKWQGYCTDTTSNPLLAEIQEAESIDELKHICIFLHSLSVFLTEIDPVGRNYDYAIYLELLANAVRANEYKLGGANVSFDDEEQIQKYGLNLI